MLQSTFLCKVLLPACTLGQRYQKIELLWHSRNSFLTITCDHEGADPGSFLRGGALVFCSTSAPINHIVFFFGRIPVVLENPRSSHGEGGGVRTPCTLPLDPPLSCQICSLKNAGGLLRSLVVVACESLKPKEKPSRVIPKAVALAYGSGRLHESFSLRSKSHSSN